MDWFAIGAYRAAGGPRLALVLDARTSYDLEAACAALGTAWRAPARGDGSVYEAWEQLVPRLRGLVATATDDPALLASLPIVTDKMVAPPRSGRIFGAASNFVDHADEMGTALAAKVDSNPFMFLKPNSAVVGPEVPVEIPSQSTQVDWEVELAVVIGRVARHVAVEDALDCVAGYTVINDVTARDLNVRDDFPFKFDWFQGKSFDTFAPLGPWVVPAAFVPDPQKLGIRLSVNGEMMQDGNTAEMIFTVAEQIAYLSSILTLSPGDIIASGTPAGVGMGRGVYLKPEDVMCAEIDGIGQLVSPVVTADLTPSRPRH